MSQMIQTSSACLMMLLLAPAAVAQVAEKEINRDEMAPAKLSVAPMDHIEYPPDRPLWVSSPPNLDQSPHTWVVVSGPSDTVQESLEDLRLMQRAAIATYIRGLPGADGRFDFYPVTDVWIDEELVARRYEGQVIQGDQQRFEHAVEIRFDQATRQRILAALKNVEVRDRLGALGVLVFLGLTGLICSSAFVGMLSRRSERKESAKVSTA